MSKSKIPLLGGKEIFMTSESLNIAERYLQYLEQESNGNEWFKVFVNRYAIHTEKASLLCLDFVDCHFTNKSIILDFWCPKRFIKDECSNGCNASIPFWLAKSNIKKYIQQIAN